MSESMHTPKPEPGALSVGARVLVRRPSEPAQTGRIVEDFAELTDTEESGRLCTPGRDVWRPNCGFRGGGRLSGPAPG